MIDQLLTISLVLKKSRQKLAEKEPLGLYYSQSVPTQMHANRKLHAFIITPQDAT